MFDDDWEASTFLYPRGKNISSASRPPITLLVISVGDNIIFDPSKEELGVAETALAVSVAESPRDPAKPSQRQLRLLAVRTIDPPSRLTPPGVPNTMNVATSGNAGAAQQKQQGDTEGVWRAPLGGTKFTVVNDIIETVLSQGGVADEVLDGLEGVDVA